MMGACIYCGTPAGIFRKQHDECAQNNRRPVFKLALNLMLDINPAVTRAIKTGMSQQEFVRQQRKRLNNPKLLQLIYNSYLRVSLAANQWERIEETRQSHPYLLYQLGPSRVHHPEHERWDGILLSARNAWWETHFPPNEWGCRCYVRQVSKVEAERMGWRVKRKPPDDHCQRHDKMSHFLRVNGLQCGWLPRSSLVFLLLHRRTE